MKRLMTPAVWLAFAIVLNPLQSFGGAVSIRGGGHGVRVRSHLYLLDLVEHGNFEVTGSRAIDERFFPIGSTASDSLPLLNGLLDLSALDERIMQIASVDPVLAMATLKTVEQMVWTLMPISLKPVDPDSSLRTQFYQLALRTGNQVSIDEALWNELNDANRVALVIHEAIAALADPSLLAAPPTRALTAKLFDEKFLMKPTTAFQADLGFFPSMSKLASELCDGECDADTVLLKSQPRNATTLEQPVLPSSTRTFIFMPGVEFLWQDPNGKLRAEHFDISPIYLYMAENLPNYCDRKGRASRLLRFQPYYRTIETEPSDVLSNGFPWPRYKTKFVRQNMPAVDVADETADPKERCTPEGRAQLQAFSRWIAGFTSMSSSR